MLVFTKKKILNKTKWKENLRFLWRNFFLEHYWIFLKKVKKKWIFFLFKKQISRTVKFDLGLNIIKNFKFLKEIADFEHVSKILIVLIFRIKIGTNFFNFLFIFYDKIGLLVYVFTLIKKKSCVFFLIFIQQKGLKKFFFVQKL